MLVKFSLQSSNVRRPSVVILPSSHQSVQQLNASNAISVNVSGKQLLTVQLPPTQPIIEISAPSSLVSAAYSTSSSSHTSRVYSSQASGEVHKMVIITTTSATANTASTNPVVPISSVAGLPSILSVISTAGHEKKSKEPHMAPTATVSISHVSPSASLDGFLLLTKQGISSSNTPIHSPERPTSSLSTPKFITNLSARSGPSLDMLHSVTKNITSLLSESESSNDKNASSLDSGNIPELHIPEDSMNLPILDISLSASFGIDDDKVHVQNCQSIVQRLNSATSASNLGQSLTSFENITEAIASLPDLNQVSVSMKAISDIDRINDHRQVNPQQNIRDRIVGCLNTGLKPIVSLGERMYGSVLCLNDNSVPIVSSLSSVPIMSSHFPSTSAALPHNVLSVAHQETVSSGYLGQNVCPQEPSICSVSSSHCSDGGLPSVTATVCLNTSRITGPALNTTLNPNLNITARPVRGTPIPLAENSSDRLFDIALGNSNSDSSFSSKLLQLLLLLFLLKKVSSARLGESYIHPISPKTPAPQYYL